MAYTERYCRAGEVGKVDARSDWYALGVTVQELLVCGCAGNANLWWLTRCLRGGSPLAPPPHHHHQAHALH